MTKSKSPFVSFQTANCLRRRTFRHSSLLFERTSCEYVDESTTTRLGKWPGSWTKSRSTSPSSSSGSSRRRSANPQLGPNSTYSPRIPWLAISLDAEPEKRRIGELQKILTGFTNTMMPDRPEPVIAAAFRDHKSLDFSESVIGHEEVLYSRRV